MEDLLKNVFEPGRRLACAGIRLGRVILRQRLIHHIRSVILCTQSEWKREHCHQENFLQP